MPLTHFSLVWKLFARLSFMASGFLLPYPQANAFGFVVGSSHCYPKMAMNPPI